MRKVRKPAAGVPRRQAARWWLDVGICLLLVAATVAVYSQVRHYEFVNYDDPEYVPGNVHVRGGLSAGGVAWALQSFDAANWFPVTWLSHMADAQLFGMDSGWHHLTNVWLHALAALVLFLALRRMTAARWRSALVGSLFALHPLHVESVAWVAERKDVLSALFWFVTLWLYAGYVKRPGVGRYLAVVAAYGVGLMSKPMLVTLPAVLLLMDVWPLGRVAWPWNWARARGLVLEKVPLLAMAAGDAVLTFLAQRQGGAVAPLAGIPPVFRMANALVSCVAYLRDMFWPAGLAVFYPYPRTMPAAEAALAGVVLAGISIAVARQFRARPYLAIGWCWYLVTLGPVIGLVQVGTQARADRYTYVPMVGLFVMLGWGAAELVERVPRARIPVTAAAVAACAACAAATWFQIQYWATSETLLRHALEVTSDNYITHHNLADYYLQMNRNEEARREDAEAVRINPVYVEARLNLGLALSLLGRPAEAETEYRKGLELHPEGKLEYVGHSGLGAVLGAQHRVAEALPELELAARLRADSAAAHYNLGTALQELGRNQEAVRELAEAVRLGPEDSEARQRLAMALTAQGKRDEAVEEFERVARQRPEDAAIQYDLGIALARAGRLGEAIAHFEEALRLRPGFAAARDALQVATAQRGGGRPVHRVD